MSESSVDIHVSVNAILLKSDFLRNGTKIEALERRERILIRAMCSEKELYNCHLEDVDLYLIDSLYSIKYFSNKASLSEDEDNGSHFQSIFESLLNGRVLYFTFYILHLISIKSIQDK